jgi:hypothetical protein
VTVFSGGADIPFGHARASGDVRVPRAHTFFSLFLATLITLLDTPIARAQDAHPISREEYESLKKQVQSLQQELQTLRDDSARKEHVDALVAQIEDEADRFDEMLAQRSGLMKFLLSGNATFSYIDRENTDSTFAAVFRPLVLWQLNDELLFEAKLELRLQDDVEETELRTLAANLTYILNDHVTLGAGKFLTPFGIYPDRFFPGKLVEDPLIYQPDVGVAPLSSLGAFVRGAFPVGSTEWNYAAYVTNGPELRTDADRAGLLNFSNSIDDNDNKAVGGRVGFLPVAALELGASVELSEVHPRGFGETTALLYALDLHYYDDIDALCGTLDVRVEFIWSDVDDVTFDPAFGPLTFDNRRHGGYVELAYRPTGFSSDFLRKLELVGRWELLEVPSRAPGPADQQRITAAVLYWITPTTAVRGGYVFDDMEDRDDQDIIFFQISVGL